MTIKKENIIQKLNAEKDTLVTESFILYKKLRITVEAIQCITENQLLMK